MAEKAVPDLAEGLQLLGPGAHPCGSVPAATSPGWGCREPPGAGAARGCGCGSCPFLPEGHRVTEACVTAGPEGWASSPLSGGIASCRLFAHPGVPHPARKHRRQFKQGRCVVTHGRAGCHPLAGDRGSARGVGPMAPPLVAGMPWPGSGTHPRGSPAPAPGQSRAGPAGILARCQATLGWKIISVSREQLMMIAGGLLTN